MANLLSDCACACVANAPVIRIISKPSLALLTSPAGAIAIPGEWLCWRQVRTSDAPPTGGAVNRRPHSEIVADERRERAVRTRSLEREPSRVLAGTGKWFSVSSRRRQRASTRIAAIRARRSAMWPVWVRQGATWYLSVASLRGARSWSLGPECKRRAHSKGRVQHQFCHECDDR